MLGYLVIAIGAYLLYDELTERGKHERLLNDGVSSGGDNGGRKPRAADQGDRRVKDRRGVNDRRRKNQAEPKPKPKPKQKGSKREKTDEAIPKNRNSDNGNDGGTKSSSKTSTRRREDSGDAKS